MTLLNMGALAGRRNDFLSFPYFVALVLASDLENISRSLKPHPPNEEARLQCTAVSYRVFASCETGFAIGAAAL
jgi:hypothetical protein